MSQRAIQIAQRIESFSNEVMMFVNQLTDEQWMTTCDAEQWPVGVTAHHISAAHLAIYGMAGMIVEGQPLPQLTMEQIHEMANQQAAVNARCTKAEVMKHLEDNTEKMLAFTRGLTDEDLDRKGSMPAFGGEVTTEQLIGFVLFVSAAEHFESIKTAAAGSTT